MRAGFTGLAWINIDLSFAHPQATNSQMQYLSLHAIYVQIRPLLSFPFVLELYHSTAMDGASLLQPEHHTIRTLQFL